jgi:hypothetical protein
MDCNQEAEQKKKIISIIILNIVIYVIVLIMITIHLNSTKHKKMMVKEKVLSIYHYYQLKNYKKYAVKH